MTVTVDTEVLPATELGLSTLGDLLCHVSNRNRLVTQVLIDGQEPDLDHVPQWRGRSLNGHTIFIETHAPADIAADVLDEIARQMDGAEAAREKAIDDLHAGAANKALQKLSGCFTAWQSAQTAISQVAKLLKIDLDRVRVEDTTLTEALANFAGQLRDVRDAIEARDYVTLADVLTYEIGRTIAQWRDALTQLRAAAV
ncbi:MAG TPA: hypothetical protein VF595_00800 [Tepidisphaeraceae bacterium]|jgi:hypothetical protein